MKQAPSGQSPHGWTPDLHMCQSPFLRRTLIAPRSGTTARKMKIGLVWHTLASPFYVNLLRVVNIVTTKMSNFNLGNWIDYYSCIVGKSKAPNSYGTQNEMWIFMSLPPVRASLSFPSIPETFIPLKLCVMCIILQRTGGIEFFVNK